MTIQQLRYVTAVAGTGTIEQLAEYIGVEPADLSATVEQYNCCRHRHHRTAG